MKTRAAVLHAFNQPFEIRELDLAEPRAGEALVRFVSSGVCHTDVSAAQGRLPVSPPIVLGHEGAAIVESVGPGVTSLQKGDHVVLAAEPHCGLCKYCLQGRPYWCVNFLRWSFGGIMPDGSKRLSLDGSELGHFFCQSSFSQYGVVPERIAVKVDPALPLEKLGPLGCGIQTGAGAVLNTGGVRSGDSVAVFGCGGVGLSAIMAAKIVGASPIIAVDLAESRLAMAKELGATYTINAGKVAPVEEIQKITGGGSDFAFECIGRDETVRQTVDSVGAGGTAVITGGASPQLQLNGSGLLSKTVKGNLEGSSIPGVFIPRLIAFWQDGRFPFDRLTSKTYSLEQINDSVAGMESGEVIKPLILY